MWNIGVKYIDWIYLRISGFNLTVYMLKFNRYARYFIKIKQFSCEIRSGYLKIDIKLFFVSENYFCKRCETLE